jgi:hypothetical protein
MFRLRKEDTSLYLYIKDIALQYFVEKQEDCRLIIEDDMSSDTHNVYSIESELSPNPFAKGRGVLYFDEDFDHCLVNTTTFSGSEEQHNRVTVYDEYNIPVDHNDYIVDYEDGRVIIPNTYNPQSADFTWNYVSVVDEWNFVEVAKPPVVVIDVNGTNKKGFQLGGGKQSDRKVNLHIFASSNAERNDIAEVLYNGLYNKSCALYEFERGAVLDYDGTFYNRKYSNDKALNLFSRKTISGTSSLKFENVTIRNVNLPITMNLAMSDLVMDDLNSYRATVSFDMRTYIEI